MPLLSRISPLLLLAGASASIACRPRTPIQASAARPDSTASAPVDDEPSAQPLRERAPPPPSDAEQTESGLSYVLQRGKGEARPPGEYDEVTIRYRVRHRDGRLIRETPADRPPDTLELQWLPPGWAEGMRLMTPGDRATMWLPAKLAYGEDGPGPTGPLVIDVELIDVVRRDDSDVPLPIAAPPAGAVSTSEGLKFVRIQRGEGDRSPARGDRIRVHYSGFTTDGEMFDSSYERGRPIEIRPEIVIEGWTLMLSRMVVGDKVRVWIPEALAYKGRAGVPAGTLVFDMELLEFLP